MLTRKGVWILDSGFWILDSGFWILDSGFWILDSGFWILDSGFWVLGSGFWVSPVSLPRHDPSIVQATRRLHPCIHPGTIRRSSRPQDAGVLSSPIRKVPMIGKRFRWPGVTPRQKTKHIHVRDFGQSSNSKFSDVLGGHGYGSPLDRDFNRLERAECTRVRL